MQRQGPPQAEGITSPVGRSLGRWVSVLGCHTAVYKAANMDILGLSPLQGAHRREDILVLKVLTGGVPDPGRGPFLEPTSKTGTPRKKRFPRSPGHAPEHVTKSSSRMW